MKRIEFAELVRQVASAPAVAPGTEFPWGAGPLERQETIMAEPARSAAISPSPAPAVEVDRGGAPCRSAGSEPQTAAEGASIDEVTKDNPIPIWARQRTAMAPEDYLRSMAEADAKAVAEERARDVELERLRGQARIIQRSMYAVRGNLLLLAPHSARERALVAQSLELLRTSLEDLARRPPERGRLGGPAAEGSQGTWVVRGNEAAAKPPVCEVVVEATLARSLRGQPLPALTITTRTSDAPAAIRHSRALALWGAAQAELMLEKSGDNLWTVGNPQWADRQRVDGGWRVAWIVYLDGAQDAPVELAMQALRDVVAGLGETFESR